MPSPSRRRDRRGQRGTALVEVTWLSLLLLVPLVYVVLASFDVQRTSFAASSAARAAARAYVTAPTEGEALPRARAAVALAFRDQHLDADLARLHVSCHPDPANCLAPGSVIDVRIATSASLPLMPSALGGSTPRVSVSASHSEPYGTFREDR